MRPEKVRPSTSRTSTLPRRSLATDTVSRLKKPASRILPEGAAPETASDPRFANLLAPCVPAALVHVKGLVGHLVHRLPVHARLPGRLAQAQLDRHHHLPQPVPI